jgi:RNA polymerase sigma-70 factor (ECF subfamily)
VSENEWLTQQFESYRPHLTAVAYRMLGTTGEADDAVQEAWLRLHRSGVAGVENLGGWLTTVVARVSLDMLRARSARREDPAGGPPLDAVSRDTATDPEQEAVLADSVGAALLVVLDTLTPSERLAFVLHDLFAVPFEEIGAVLGRSTPAAKQLASRARQKVRGSDPPEVEPDPERQRQVVTAFLAAARHGSFDELVALLHPGIVLRADPEAVRIGAPQELRGADAVAAMFSGRALGAEAAIIDGTGGLVWEVAGRLKVAWRFTITDGAVAYIEMVADPGRLEVMEVVLLPA